MTRHVLGFGAVIMLCGCTSAVVDPDPAMRIAPAVSVAASGNVAGRLLDAHNRTRAAAGAPPLSWDSRLAAGAQAHAAQLARTGQLAHSPRQSRPGQGENLWMGSAGAYTPEFMIQSWADERRHFRPGRFPNVSTTGNWADVAHYTQMIWRSTTSVGCAIQRSGRWDVLVCRYSPPGNRDGQAVP